MAAQSSNKNNVKANGIGVSLGPYGCGGYNTWNRCCYGPGCRRWF